MQFVLQLLVLLGKVTRQFVQLVLHRGDLVELGALRILLLLQLVSALLCLLVLALGALHVGKQLGVALLDDFETGQRAVHVGEQGRQLAIRFLDLAL